MLADRSSPPRRALSALVLVIGLVLVAGQPTGAAPVARQTDPAPTSDPLAPTDAGAGSSTTVAGDATTDTGATEAETDAAIDAAQDQADEDLRAVWMVVAALGVVALGLLVLLVLYVRSTKPERVAARRARLLDQAEARAARRSGAAPDDRAGSDDPDDDDPVDEPLVPVAAASSDVAGDAVLSRDPSEAAEEGVRVIGSAPVASAPVGTPARPDVISPPVTKAGSSRPAKGPGKGARTNAPAPAGPPPGPADGDETVRIVPAPPVPAPMPGPPPARQAAPTVAARVSPPPSDRPPPRSLIDSPPPRPKRPRRVEAPAKQLATPDAERVLVRPGQKPVRVPPRPDRGEEPTDPGTAGGRAADADR